MPTIRLAAIAAFALANASSGNDPAGLNAKMTRVRETMGLYPSNPDYFLFLTPLLNDEQKVALREQMTSQLRDWNLRALSATDDKMEKIAMQNAKYLREQWARGSTEPLAE